ncbi:nucleotidyl transferase AbiEii/AbiGii toxin family protein (plasmid) [Nocardia sp. CA-084685]|uniref:nucleotidyl transferase AbiEii/AbiGii toxin family protein n=1 Tax=Nocardia sp. CA-084685 TaxID=3239970 RepID=UPI003D989236
MDPALREAKKLKNKLGQLIEASARASGRDYASRVAELHQQLIMQRFLTRVFDQPGPWMLAGGTGLLVRLPGARHSQDIDLNHRGGHLDVDNAINELHDLAGPHPSDPFAFSITVKNELRGANPGATLFATPYFAGTTLSMTPIRIDLAVRRSVVGSVDRITPAPVLELAEIRRPPPMTIYPIADQVADKIAGMYQLFGGRNNIPSSRWRDLADLLLITHNLPLDAATVQAALAEHRGINFPRAVHAPSPEWAHHYPILAATTTLPRRLHTLDAALGALGRCVNPMLDGTVTVGTWNPRNQRWDRDLDHHSMTDDLAAVVDAHRHAATRGDSRPQPTPLLPPSDIEGASAVLDI